MSRPPPPRPGRDGAAVQMSVWPVIDDASFYVIDARCAHVVRRAEAADWDDPRGANAARHVGLNALRLDQPEGEAVRGDAEACRSSAMWRIRAIAPPLAAAQALGHADIHSDRAGVGHDGDHLPVPAVAHRADDRPIAVEDPAEKRRRGGPARRPDRCRGTASRRCRVGRPCRRC